jgi:hypothetical protein
MFISFFNKKKITFDILNVYKSLPGKMTTQNFDITVEDGGLFVMIPQPVTCFANARYFFSFLLYSHPFPQFSCPIYTHFFLFFSFLFLFSPVSPFKIPTKANI